MVVSGLSMCVMLRGHKKLGDHTRSKEDSVVTYVHAYETYNEYAYNYVQYTHTVHKHCTYYNIILYNS